MPAHSSLRSSPHPAVRRVLLIPELLELILLHLPLQDVLVIAQRVSRGWKAAIDSSPALQEALFFRPIPSTAQPGFRCFNPLLQKAFPPWFSASHDERRGTRAIVAAVPWAASQERRAAFVRADASWRRMLPCQPAKTVLEVAGKNNTARGIFETNGAVRFDVGIRMGRLYDFCFDVIRVYASSFWILWHEPEEEGGEPEKMTIFTHHSWFKARNRPPQVGEELRSEAYEETVIEMREERRFAAWHQGFCRPPRGGWHLRQPSAP